jgi:hypothetical protein
MNHHDIIITTNIIIFSNLLSIYTNFNSHFNYIKDLLMKPTLGILDDKKLLKNGLYLYSLKIINKNLFFF